MLTGISLLIVIFLALVFIVAGCSVFRWHPFLVLLVTSFLLAFAVGIPFDRMVPILMEGGGVVFQNIGIIISLGTLLGTVLEKTGAAETLAQQILSRAGKKNLLPGLSILGAITGIPVFCDSGFVILTNLGRSLSQRSGRSFGAISIALATGLYSTHVLVPPTPGPLAAAGSLGMNDQLGFVILLGLVVSIPAVVIGFLMAGRFGDKSAEVINPNIPENVPVKLPGLTEAWIPLLLPVVLIAGGSFSRLFALPEQWMKGILFICNPNIALLLGVIIALGLPGRKHRKDWMNWTQTSLSQAGPIILITVAGGALGAILKATPLSDMFTDWVQQKQIPVWWLFPVSFLLAAALKTSQGSSTAALVISSSMIASLIPAYGNMGDADKALLVMCIGGGAMTVSHANDSYFWVISQYAGIPVSDMYRHFTLPTLLMGLSVLATSLLLAMVL